MSTRKTALFADPIVVEHHTPPGHPERPDRYHAIVNLLEESGLRRDLVSVPVRAATEEEMAACHTHSYLKAAQREIESGAPELSTGDTSVSSKSWEVAIRAAGGVLNAVEMVVERKVDNAFCAVRPPGHHATPSIGMGFCVVNNVAIAARYAQRKYGIDRVLIVDWDVHHGNGTQDIFYHDGSVFFFSTHQSPWYPHTGAPQEVGDGEGEGTTLNCPFPAGAGRKEILGAFQERLLPITTEFKPELVLISAGFDSRRGDPLGNFMLGDQEFHDLTQVMLEIADQHAGGRLVSVLEGGYSLTGLAAAAATHVEALAGV